MDGKCSSEAHRNTIENVYVESGVDICKGSIHEIVNRWPWIKEMILRRLVDESS